MATATSCAPSTAPADEAVDPAKEFGIVRGTIIDQFNIPVAGAVVDLVQGGLSYGRSSPSTATGAYEIIEAHPGSYQLSATKAGFAVAQTPIAITKGGTLTVPITLNALSAPVAAAVAVRVISFTTSSMTFEVDVAAVGSNGAIVAPGAATYAIPSFTVSSGRTYTITPVSTTMTTIPAAGPFAAMFMMDQSGSISGTDPNNSRLTAAKAFMAKLGTGDRVRVGAFSSGGSLPFTITMFGSWNSNGPSWFPTIDDLATKVSGGTPLYKAIAAAIDDVSANGGLANKAAIIFTDGDDTDGGWTVDQLVALALSRGVKLWTVGLQVGSQGHQVLGELAARTGGGLTIASNAPQLVSYFGSLGGMLRGGASVARTRWTMTASGGLFTSGWVTTSVRVTTSEGTVNAPFYLKYP